MPCYVLRWLNLIYSTVMLWVYQCYVEMIVSDSFNGLIIKKDTETTILYVHSGFSGISTSVNDLGFNINMSYRTGQTVLTVDYDNIDFDRAVENIKTAYDWLQERCEKVVLVGSGIGCYLIQLLLSSSDFNPEDKLDVIFISPITQLNLRESDCLKDYLNYEKVVQALDSSSGYAKDFDSMVSKINKIFVTYGSKEMFKRYTVKFLDKIRNKTKIPLTTVACRGGEHCHLLFDNLPEHSDRCFRKMNDFLNNE